MTRKKESTGRPTEADLSRDDLIKRYQKYVHHVVARLVSHMNLPVTHYDEYVSAGYLGLVEAAERFDRDQGTNFKTYAFLRIRGAVIDSIRSTSELQGRAYRYAKAVKASLDLREVSLEESGRRGGKKDGKQKLADILDYVAKSALSFRLSLTDAAQEVNGIEDKGRDPEEHYENREDRVLLMRLLESLPENERKVIEDYYFRDLNLTEMAAEDAAHSKSWLCRLHTRALEHLKERYLELQEGRSDKDE